MSPEAEGPGGVLAPSPLNLIEKRGERPLLPKRASVQFWPQSVDERIWDVIQGVEPRSWFRRTSGVSAAVGEAEQLQVAPFDRAIPDASRLRCSQLHALRSSSAIPATAAAASDRGWWANATPPFGE